eukprot:TRINITY_DN7581_c0_g2_i1.p1 TRINITY_DN7581_c0_g2~~TRINITY_DN7581_c0_g2_i1.p1  ORF type:complete len:216 (-),score=55.60 TRINITY_DN7581_c0_g2_i1:320-967(-)
MMEAGGQEGQVQRGLRAIYEDKITEKTPDHSTKKSEKRGPTTGTWSPPIVNYGVLREESGHYSYRYIIGLLCGKVTGFTRPRNRLVRVDLSFRTPKGSTPETGAYCAKLKIPYAATLEDASWDVEPDYTRQMSVTPMKSKNVLIVDIPVIFPHKLAQAVVTDFADDDSMGEDDLLSGCQMAMPDVSPLSFSQSPENGEKPDEADKTGETDEADME